MRALHDLPFSEEHSRQADTPKPAAAANEDCLLSELQFLCAHTNMSIGTGVLTDSRALALAKARGCMMHLKCQHCGMTHSLTMDEAMLVRSLRWEDRADRGEVELLPVIATGHPARKGKSMTASARPQNASPMNLSAPDQVEVDTIDLARLLKVDPRRPYP